MKLYMSKCCNQESWVVHKYPGDHPLAIRKCYNICTQCKREYHCGPFEDLFDGAKYTGFLDSEGFWEIQYPNGNICETNEFPILRIIEPTVIDFTKLPIVAVVYKGKKGLLLESQNQLLTNG